MENRKAASKVAANARPLMAGSIRTIWLLRRRLLTLTSGVIEVQTHFGIVIVYEAYRRAITRFQNRDRKYERRTENLREFTIITGTAGREVRRRRGGEGITQALRFYLGRTPVLNHIITYGRR